jgi:hypothetical protein
LTKHLHEDALKNLSIEDPVIEVVPKMIDQSMVIGGSQVVRKPKATKTRIAKSRMPVKKTSRLEKAIAHLYNLDDAHEPEKPLNIDLGLYQMENF